MAAIIGNRNISLGVMGGTLITACAGFGGDVFGCSPYDAATTAYLKATYPAYWQAIRNFGLDNPQLVPEIEANPRGWGGYIAYTNPLESVEFGTYGRIDSGIIGGSDICTFIDVELNGKLQWIINGVGSNSNKRYAVLNDASYTSLRFHYGTHDNGNVMGKLIGRHTIEINNGKLLIDGVQKDIATNVYTSDATIKFGGLSYDPASGISINFLHKCNIWRYSTNEKLRELLPCKRKADNLEGVWDLVNAEFLIKKTA